MLYPSIDILLKQTVDSKYSLVVAASKRARMLRDGGKTQLEHPRSHKYVGVALEEMYAKSIYLENAQSQKLN